MSRYHTDMDMSDSRKRPLDGESESGATKRSNQGGVASPSMSRTGGGEDGYDGYDGSLMLGGHDGHGFKSAEYDMRSDDGQSTPDWHETEHRASENVHLKVLVPSVAAGAIIGKGGETITQVQKEAGAIVKMSKANDYYPGTTERVCLITGQVEAVRKVHNFIMDKIREKPDTNPKPLDGDLKVNFERHKQVKILVPNSTAGMIIGKGGVYIRQIKEDSGAYVQISQKSKDMNLPERCVTIAGSDPDQNRHAVDMILQKIVEDPQSGSCPNISYADYKGPVASSNPTGSPFANTMQMGQGFNGQIAQNFNGGNPGNLGNIGNSMNNLNLNSSGQTNVNNPVVENLKTTLRGSGYSEQATEEIAAAMYTLANYGFLGLGLGLGINIGSNLGNLGAAGGGGGGAGMNIANQGGQGNPTPNAGSLANLIGMLGSSNSGNSTGSLLGGSTNNTVSDNTSVFGPVGSTTTTMAGGDTGEGTGAFFSTAGGMGGDRYSGAGDSMFGNSYNSGFGSGSSFGGPNQNSFGLGTGMGTSVGSFGETASNEDESTVKEVEVGEHIVGAILGPKGKGIVELQKYTNTNIQISRKGVFAPGTRNRVVTIKGASNNVQKAAFLIQQRLSQEESKRARQGTASTP